MGDRAAIERRPLGLTANEAVTTHAILGDPNIGHIMSGQGLTFALPSLGPMKRSIVFFRGTFTRH
jgi:hypothetical protein